MNIPLTPKGHYIITKNMTKNSKRYCTVPYRTASLFLTEQQNLLFIVKDKICKNKID